MEIQGRNPTLRTLPTDADQGNEVVKAGISLAGIELTPGDIDLIGWLGYVVTAIVITIVMIVLIIVIGRWGSK